MRTLFISSDISHGDEYKRASLLAFLCKSKGTAGKLSSLFRAKSVETICTSVPGLLEHDTFLGCVVKEMLLRLYKDFGVVLSTYILLFGLERLVKSG